MATKTKENERNPNTFILIIGILVILTASIALILHFNSNSRLPEHETIVIREEFIDVNGDGLTDYVIEGEIKVVMNEGESNFMEGQVQPKE